jgi:BASS family bile acid:Na+ symporter
MADGTGNKYKNIYYLFLAIGIIALLATIILVISGNIAKAGVPAVTMFVAGAFYAKGSKILKGSSFTFWVFAFLVAALYFPWLFTNWGFNTMKLVIPLIMLIMFGMGTKLSIGDFVREFKNPKGLIVGTFLVYSIMPLAGLIIVKAFGFEPEIAAGVILIGSCPGGTASNVMTFLANANVALSVTLTSFATLISPLVTPILMKLFAGKYINIDFMAMMLSIVKLIILPIAAGLVVNKLLRNRKKWLDKLLPLVSMIAILFFVTIVVAHYRNQLLVVGLALIGAVIIHNFVGYLFGYWGGKIAGLNEKDSRTVAIEVGLKNGGMGMGLALDVLKSPNAAFAPIIFGKWMNISGSILANYWRNRPVKDEKTEKKQV